MSWNECCGCAMAFYAACEQLVQWLECRFWIQKVDGSNPSINMFSP